MIDYQPSKLTFIGSRRSPSLLTYLKDAPEAGEHLTYFGLPVPANDLTYFGLSVPFNERTYLGGEVLIDNGVTFIRGYVPSAGPTFILEDQPVDNWGCILCSHGGGGFGPNNITWDDGDAMLWDEGDGVESDN